MGRLAEQLFGDADGVKGKKAAARAATRLEYEKAHRAPSKPWPYHDSMMRPASPLETAENNRLAAERAAAEFRSGLARLPLDPSDPSDPGALMEMPIRKQPSVSGALEDTVRRHAPAIDTALRFAPATYHTLHSPNPKDGDLETALVQDYSLLRAAGLVGEVGEAGFALTKAGQAWLRYLAEEAGPTRAAWLRSLNPGRLFGEAAGGAGYQVGVNHVTGRPLGEGVPEAAATGPIVHAGGGLVRELVVGPPPMKAPVRVLSRRNGEVAPVLEALPSAHPIAKPSVAPAPAQQPGAVRVSGEPSFSAAARESLAQARKDTYARIADRQPRKAPPRLPRGPKGMRVGAAIGPDAFAAELGDLFDHALIGATHLADGVLDRTEWNLRMLAQAGEQIEPQLDRIWELAHRIRKGWEAGQIPLDGDGVPEAARSYLLQTEAKTATPVDLTKTGMSSTATQVPRSGVISGVQENPRFQVGDRVNIKGSSGRKPTIVEAVNADGTVKVKQQRDPLPTSDLDLIMSAPNVPTISSTGTATDPRPRRKMHSFEIGDRIVGKSTTGNVVEGVVKEVHSRRTVIRTDDGETLFVDNRTADAVGKPIATTLDIPTHLPDRFREIYAEAHADRLRNRSEPFWTVGNEEAARLADELDGLDLSGRVRYTSTQAMRHGEKRHGVENENRTGQLPITAADVAKVPDVIANHDLAYLGEVVEGKQRIVYQKRVNGHIFYVEEVVGSKRLDAVTMWKREAGKKGASGSFDQTGYAPRKEAAGPGVAGDSSIEQGSSGVNSPPTTDTQSSTSLEPGRVAGGSSKLWSGALVLGAGSVVKQQQKPSGGNDRGGMLLAKAVAVRGSLKHDSYVDAEGKRRIAKWYGIGRTPAARADREAMVTHLLGRRPEWAGRRWFVPGVGNGTLQALVVEGGVVPAEVGNVYRQGGQPWRSGGGRTDARGEMAPVGAGGYR